MTSYERQLDSSLRMKYYKLPWVYQPMTETYHTQFTVNNQLLSIQVGKNGTRICGKEGNTIGHLDTMYDAVALFCEERDLKQNQRLLSELSKRIHVL